MKKIIKRLDCINASRILASHLVGDNHTDNHRRVFGVVIMGLGVTIQNIHVDTGIIHLMIEGFGAAIHAIGFLPFAANMEKQIEHANG